MNIITTTMNMTMTTATAAPAAATTMNITIITPTRSLPAGVRKLHTNSPKKGYALLLRRWTTRTPTKGFLAGCAGSLTRAEVEMLPMGAKLMTLECGIRFLADYLMGDTYFKTAYPEHNLVRARTQIALVADMEEKWGEMENIVARASFSH